MITKVKHFQKKYNMTTFWLKKMRKHMPCARLLTLIDSLCYAWLPACEFHTHTHTHTHSYIYTHTHIHTQTNKQTHTNDLLFLHQYTWSSQWIQTQITRHKLDKKNTYFNSAKWKIFGCRVVKASEPKSITESDVGSIPTRTFF